MSKYHKDLSEEEKVLFEKLADIEHQRWASWQKYFHSKCLKHKMKSLNSKTKQLEDIETGHMVIPKDAWNRAERQIETSYDDLSEVEKDSDREQVIRYWKLIK